LPYRHDPDRFIQEIAKHYATDPVYSDKVIGLMRNYNLYSLNSATAPDPGPAQVSVSVTTWGDGLQVFGRGVPGGHVSSGLILRRWLG